MYTVFKVNQVYRISKPFTKIKFITLIGGIWSLDQEVSDSWNPQQSGKPWIDLRDSCTQCFRLSSAFLVLCFPRSEKPVPDGLSVTVSFLAICSKCTRCSPCWYPELSTPSWSWNFEKIRNCLSEGKKSQGIETRKLQVAAKHNIPIILVNITKYSGRRRRVSSSTFLEMRIVGF